MLPPADIKTLLVAIGPLPRLAVEPVLTHNTPAPFRFPALPPQSTATDTLPTP